MFHHKIYNVLPHLLIVCPPYQINFKILRKFIYDTGVKMHSIAFDLNCYTLLILHSLSSALSIHRQIQHAFQTKIFKNYLR